MGKDPAPTPRAISVDELNQQARSLLEQNFSSVLVEGEISRPTHASSGHVYFGLKDSKARVDAVLWARDAAQLGFTLEEGQRVLARGQLTVWPPQGRYQFVCRQLTRAGEGALLEALRRLTAKLAGEGLLDEARKRALPRLPHGIGLVTSGTGAAVQDMLRTILNRFPSMRIVVCPVRVQGAGAAEDVAAGLARVARVPGIDVIVVGRGGGSLEDLWAFNEEVVARAIAASPIPVVSAVGHEIDRTLSDEVADARAPTPTAAGELVVPLLAELLEGLADKRSRLDTGIVRACKEVRAALESLGGRSGLRLFPRVLDELRQALDDESRRRSLAIERLLLERRARMQRLAGGLEAGSPLQWLRERRTRITGLVARLAPAARAAVGSANSALGPLAGRIDALSPIAVLSRGFSVTRVARDGRLSIVRSQDEVGAGDVVRTTFAEGDDLVTRAEGAAERDLPTA